MCTISRVQTAFRTNICHLYLKTYIHVYKNMVLESRKIKTSWNRLFISLYAGPINLCLNYVIKKVFLQHLTYDISYMECLHSVSLIILQSLCSLNGFLSLLGLMFCFFFVNLDFFLLPKEKICNEAEVLFISLNFIVNSFALTDLHSVRTVSYSILLHLLHLQHTGAKLLNGDWLRQREFFS